MSETDEGGRATKRKLGKVVRDIQASFPFATHDAFPALRREQNRRHSPF